MVVCSPVASSTSISRSLGRGMISLASLMRLSVTPLMAETTTTTLLPGCWYSGHARGDVLDPLGIADRGAAIFLNNQCHTCSSLSANQVRFARLLSSKVLDADHHGLALDHRQRADLLQAPSTTAPFGASCNIMISGTLAPSWPSGWITDEMPILASPKIVAIFASVPGTSRTSSRTK